jgi:WD40 repeat protein
MPTPDNPYVGPRPLEPGEPLFGRDGELDELQDLLGAERIILLHSPSGAGKSSLVQAGLLPRLRDRFDVWRPTRVGLPLPDGVAANRHALSAMLGFEQDLPDDLRRPLQQLEGLDLAAYVATRHRCRDAPEHVLLIFDQFEEILTVDPLAVAAKQAFFGQLGALLKRPGIWALFALREDYLAPLDPYVQRVPTHLRNRYRIDRLTTAGAREAIVGPTLGRARGWSDEAVDRLVRDLATVKIQQADGSFADEVGLHVEPMQLQVVCRGLWDRMPAGDASIDPDDLVAFGDVTHALGDYYAAEVRRIAGDDASERALRTWVGEELMTSDGVRTPVLRTVGASEGLANATIVRLVDAHLVRAEHRGGAVWYELAHDRLVRPIRVDNEAWAQDHLQPMQAQAVLWARQGKPASLLLSDEALIAADAWVVAQTGPLGEPDQSFLAASRALRAQERAVRDAQAQALTAAQALAAAQTHAAARQRRFTVVVAVLGLLAVAATIATYWQYQEAVEQTDRADKRTEEAKDQTIRAQDQTRMAAARAAAGDPTTQAALLREVTRPGETLHWIEMAGELLQRPIAEALLQHDTTVLHASISPDGARVLSLTADHTARVWPADGEGEPVVLRGHAAGVNSAAFAPDSRRVVTASGDSTARVWTLDAAIAPVILRGHTSAVTSAVFSPDGQRVLTTAEDGMARVWMADGTGEPVDHPVGSFNRGIRFSPDGTRLLTFGGTKAVHVSQSDGSGKTLSLVGEQGTMSEYVNEIYDANFSPDGQRVVTAARDGTVVVWRIDGPARPTRLSASGRSVAFSPDGTAVLTMFVEPWLWPADGSKRGERVEADRCRFAIFSPDGHKLLTASDTDGSAKVWNLVDNAVRHPTMTLAGNSGPVVAAAFSADGQRVVTAGDKTVRVWRLGAPAVRERMVGLVNLVSPDRRQILTRDDTKLRLWQLDTDAPPRDLEHPIRVDTMVFSPGGSHIVTTSESSEIAWVWRTAGETTPVLLRGHQHNLLSATFSPDGGRVMTTSQDGTARLWRTDDGAALLVAPHSRQAFLGAKFSPDGTTLATWQDGEARIWRGNSGEPVTLQGIYIGALIFSPDGAHVTTFSDVNAHIRRTDGTGEPLLLAGHTSEIHTVEYSPDGRHVLTAASDAARVWPADGSTAPVTLAAPAGKIDAAKFSPDNAHVLTVSGGTAHLWSVDAPGEPAVFEFEGGVQSMRIEHTEFSRDGRWLLASWEYDRTRMWRLDTGEVVDQGAGRGAVFTPDGRRVLLFIDDGVRVWPAVTPEDMQATLWDVTSLCLSVKQRMDRLGEPQADASLRMRACLDRIAGRDAAQ